MPLALTGPLGSVGQQLKRGGEAWAKARNAEGGLLGRQIQLLIEDTAGNPADCVREAQEMVERDGCNIFTGISLSSEALAVVDGQAHEVHIGPKRMHHLGVLRGRANEEAEPGALEKLPE